MSKPEITPALLPESFEQMSEEIARVVPLAKAGLINTIQIDVTDGHFAPTKTWPYNATPKGEDANRWLRIVSQEEGLPNWEDVNFEVDLMVEDQIAAARHWISAGVTRVIGHIESLSDEDTAEFKRLCRDAGVEIVFSLNPSTPNKVLDVHLADIDGVQFMGNDKIGYHGVELDEAVLEKVAGLRAQMPDLPIGIDIGVSFDTIPRLADAGVTRFASGSLILEADDPRAVVEKMQMLFVKSK